MTNFKPENVELGRRIKSIRKGNAMTMSEFLAKVDDKPVAECEDKTGTVNNWESGRNKPNLKRLKKIAEIGNVSVQYLLGTSAFDLSDAIDKFQAVIDKTNGKILSNEEQEQLHELQTKINIINRQEITAQNQDNKEKLRMFMNNDFNNYGFLDRTCLLHFIDIINTVRVKSDDKVDKNKLASSKNNGDETANTYLHLTINLLFELLKPENKLNDYDLETAISAATNLVKSIAYNKNLIIKQKNG